MNFFQEIHLQPIDSQGNGNIVKLVIHIRKCKRSLSMQNEKEIIPGSQPAILGLALRRLSLQELGASKVRRGKRSQRFNSQLTKLSALF